METCDSQDFSLKGIFEIKSKVSLQAGITLTLEKVDTPTTSCNVLRTGSLLPPQITYFIPGGFSTLGGTFLS